MGEAQETALCPSSLGWGEELAGISTRLQPCPTGQPGETWRCLLPRCQAQTPPTRAGVLPWTWHGASLAMAMGSRGVRGEKELPGPWSPCSLPPPGMWSPAPHSMGATGVRQADREQGWGELGRYWVACLVQRDSCWGCPDTPCARPADQDPALPQGQTPGLAAPKGRQGSQAVPSTLPQKDPPPAPSIPGDLSPPAHPTRLGRGCG